MSFVVSARKYRPQHFDELVGQDHIAGTLKKAIENDQLAHAFLFAGPRGVGKTTSARILAKVLNCLDKTDLTKACNECSSCQSFSNNASFNIFELDAASNNSVDHIRALNDQVRFQPQQGSYKIYIIDEVHMLSQAAFNAFLKTLEEPPPYAKFILATTEKHKIIPTILSRCQVFDFKRISVKDIIDQLNQIKDKEQRNFDAESLHLIAEKADGAMRDALSIYDKVVSSISGDIQYSEVAEVLNVLDNEVYFSLVDLAIKKDRSGLMLAVDDVIKRGFGMEQLIFGLMKHLRQLMFIKDIRTAELIESTESLKARYVSQAELVTNTFLLSGLSLLEKTDLNLPRAQNKRLSVELALSKLAHILDLVDSKKKTELVKKQEQPKEVEPSVAAKKPNKDKKADEIIKEEAPNRIESSEQSKEVTPEASPTKQPPSKPLNAKSKQDTNINRVAKISSVPKLEVDLNALVENIKQEEAAQRAINNPFSPDHIDKVIAEYKIESDSNTLKAALEHVKVDIDEETIFFKMPLEINKEMLRNENALLERIRSQYPLMEVKMKFEVDLSAFPDYVAPQKKEILGPAEKYQKLLSKNPAFKDLVAELKLKPSK